MKFHFVDRSNTVGQRSFDFAEEKFREQIAKFVDGPITIHVIFSEEAGYYTIHIDLHSSSPVRDIHLNQKSEDIHTAINKLSDKIKKSLAREKEKSTSHRPKRSNKATEALNEEE